jgi:hypothetical protein
MADQTGVAFLKPSIAGLPAELATLKLPDNRTLAHVHGGELARVLVQLGVPGASHENGRQENARTAAARPSRVGCAR